jgi:hypothetical protein
MKDHTRNRIQLALITVLLVVIAAMAYKFIFVGSVERAADERAAILLERGASCELASSGIEMDSCTPAVDGCSATYLTSRKRDLIEVRNSLTA